jgi:hypothetical protein
LIYFLQSLDSLDIKIGYTGESAEVRLAQLQTGNPAGLRLLAEIPGERADEYELHLRFAACRVRGEWFRPTPELLSYLLSAVKREESLPLHPLSDPWRFLRRARCRRCGSQVFADLASLTAWARANLDDLQGMLDGRCPSCEKRRRG